MVRFRQFYISLAFCLLLAIVPSSFGYQTGKPIISSEEDVSQDIPIAPCNDRDRLKAVNALFLKMSAPSDDIVIENLDGVENLVIRKRGNSQETIIVGAHYDKVPDGCGAIDNWSGIVALAHIYRSLKDVPLEKTLIFAAFGKEEKGLHGSRAMVKRIKWR